MKTYYWSRCPGKFVDVASGECLFWPRELDRAPKFTGTVREWYETAGEVFSRMWFDAVNHVYRASLPANSWDNHVGYFDVASLMVKTSCCYMSSEVFQIFKVLRGFRSGMLEVQGGYLPIVVDDDLPDRSVVRCLTLFSDFEVAFRVTDL
jgi:hypothetical protein